MQKCTLLVILPALLLSGCSSQPQRICTQDGTGPISIYTYNCPVEIRECVVLFNNQVQSGTTDSTCDNKSTDHRIVKIGIIYYHESDKYLLFIEHNDVTKKYVLEMPYAGGCFGSRAVKKAPNSAKDWATVNDEHGGYRLLRFVLSKGYKEMRQYADIDIRAK